MPAAPLLQAAPWVFVRGNHEACARNGVGWFRLLDPQPAPARCEDYTPPYTIPLGSTRLVVFDSVVADDAAVHPQTVAAYARQFEAARALSGPGTWLLSHRPLWGVRHANGPNGTERLVVNNLTLQAASGGAAPAGVQLVLSGHIHLVEALSFAAHVPQLIVGVSGTERAPAISSGLAGVTVGGAPISAGWVSDAFGYLTLEREPDGWRGMVRGTHGEPRLSCMLHAAALACAPPTSASRR